MAFVDSSDVEVQTLHHLTTAIQKHLVSTLLLVLQQIVEITLSSDLLQNAHLGEAFHKLLPPVLLFYQTVLSITDTVLLLDFVAAKPARARHYVEFKVDLVDWLRQHLSETFLFLRQQRVWRAHPHLKPGFVGQVGISYCPSDAKSHIFSLVL